MADEISAGLRNAIERGESIEEAIQTFINAGYNPVEVKEAATLVSGVVSLVNNPSVKMPPQFSSIASQSQSSPQINYPQALSSPIISPVQPNSSMSPDKKKTIALLAILILLIGILLAIILFKDDILSFIK